jgi:hypothetical protein
MNLSPHPKLFRNPKSKQCGLTTVVAILAKDGIVMASDVQSTGFTQEEVPKIIPIGGYGLLGCAGTAEYIGLFRQYAIQGIDETDGFYIKQLNAVVDSYGTYVAQRIDNLKLSRLTGFDPRNCYPQGIFAGREKSEPISFDLVEINTPEPCRMLEPGIERRLATGSGGVAATVILKTIENYLGRSDRIGWSIWEHFSTRTVAQLLVILLEQVSRIDPYSSGATLAKLTGKECEPYNIGEIFDGEYKDRLKELLSSAVAEMPPRMRTNISKSKVLLEWLTEL